MCVCIYISYMHKYMSVYIRTYMLTQQTYIYIAVIAGKASRDDLQDVLTMVRNTSNPQVEYIVRIIKKYCKDNNLKIQ